MEKTSHSNTANKKAIKNKKRFALFVISIGLFMLSSLLLSSCSSINNQNTNKEIAQIAFAENTTLISSEIKVTNINKNLLFIDYNNDKVCGFFGCLFSIYHQDKSNYTRLWSGYLQKVYPPHKSIFEVEKSKQEYPCINFHQLDLSTYKKLTYCFNGKNYQQTNSLFYR